MKKNAQQNGYYLCPDKELLNSLLQGIATNTNRYGYGACPCRIASGMKQYDNDIICPCEYRDADVNEFGMCYCGLFVNKELRDNSLKMKPIPERRPVEIQDMAINNIKTNKTQSKKKLKTQFFPDIKIWRCSVCGYLCARELPPPLCPICKAKAERFEQFTLK